MRIGLAIYNFNPRKGGAERYAYDLALYLARKGHEVYVFCARGIPVEGIYVIPFTVMPYPRWLRTLGFALRHRKIIRYVPLDIKLCFGNTLEADVYQSHGGVQKIWMEREIASYDDAKEKKRKAFLLKWNMNQKLQELIAEFPIRTNKQLRVVAISDMVKGQLVRHYDLKEETVDVVYNGVDTTRFAPAQTKPGGRLKILFSAGNFRLKGLSPLLSALGLIARHRKDFQLIIMGRGRQERYKAMMEELRLDDHVRFLGEISSPEAVYRDAHVLAHPTFYDACSLTTMESMATGLPTITTLWNGASALISDDNGFVIDEPRNIEGLASAIDTLFDEEKRRIMGEKARERLEGFTIERNAGLMEGIFQEVCDGR
jgi:UDP-glucose:(heptosyl)LPS alpha-1,3-glucosyltransferase